MNPIKEIPPNLASRTKWEQRGYRVRMFEKRVKEFTYWNGLKFMRFDLFHINQTDCIRGEKARIRRRIFHHEWLAATERECP